MFSAVKQIPYFPDLTNQKPKSTKQHHIKQPTRVTPTIRQQLHLYERQAAMAEEVPELKEKRKAIMEIMQDRTLTPQGKSLSFNHEHSIVERWFVFEASSSSFFFFFV